jgi:signal transduction histidine kinase
MRDTAQNGTTIRFNCRGDCTNTYLDEKLLRQILTNLLTNAVKYSPHGSTVRFEIECKKDIAVLRIQDEGIGIPTEDLPELFESFHRASNVGTIPGTGLGLAIVKKSVDLHGGQLAVDSVVGVGTTFTLTLPCTCLSSTR